MLTAGIAAIGGSRVPKNSPTRSSPGTTLPWLNTITALAPAAAALSTLMRKVQVPRWMRAMWPAGKPAKSPASQPLVEGAVTGEVDVDHLYRCGYATGARVGHRCEVLVLHIGDRTGRRLRHRAPIEDELLVGELLPPHHVSGIIEQVLDVDARGLVARRSCGTGAPVGVRDLLERLLMGEDALNGDRVAERPRIGAVVGRRGRDECGDERRDGGKGDRDPPALTMVHHALLLRSTAGMPRRTRHEP